MSSYVGDDTISLECWGLFDFRVFTLLCIASYGVSLLTLNLLIAAHENYTPSVLK